MIDSPFGINFSTPIAPCNEAKKHTMSPSCSGTSVIGIKYKDGIILAADSLVSYGSLARYTNYDRVSKVNAKTVLACSGDIADFQLISRYIEQQTLLETLLGDGFLTTPQALHSWITRVMYNRRSQFDPLWNTYIIGGLQDDGTPFLGYSNMIGVSFAEDTVATGFGAHLVAPILRKAIETKAGGDSTKLSKDDALTAIRESMLMLFYRDCRAFNMYKTAIVSKSGAKISENTKLKTNWQIAEGVAGYE